MTSFISNLQGINALIKKHYYTTFNRIDHSDDQKRSVDNKLILTILVEEVVKKQKEILSMLDDDEELIEYIDPESIIDMKLFCSNFKLQTENGVEATC